MSLENTLSLFGFGYLGYLIFGMSGSVLVLGFVFVYYIYQRRKYLKLAENAIPLYFSVRVNQLSDSYNNKLDSYAIEIARYKAICINYYRKDQLINPDLTSTDFEDGFCVDELFETEVDIYTEKFLDAVEPLYYLYFYELKGKTPAQLTNALADVKLQSKSALNYYLAEYNIFVEKCGVRPAHPYWMDLNSM